MNNVAAARMQRKSARYRGRRILIYSAVLFLLFIALFPFLWLVFFSLKTGDNAFQMPPQLIFTPTLRNYTRVLESNFLKAFSNSAVVSIGTTLISLVLGVPAAYALSRAKFKSERLISLWALTTRMAPPIAFGIPFFLIYKRLDMIDTKRGLVIVYLTFNISLVIWMMRTFFDGLSVTLEEAAYVDGAGILETFLKVTLPLAAPGLAATAIFCFLLSWNDFFYALILTRREAVTAPVAIANFTQYESWDWGRISAGGTFIILPVVIFSLAVNKYLVRGLTAGAIKG